MNENVIVYISPHRNLYGAEKSLISLMLGARHYGFKPVLIIGGDGPIENELKKNAIDYIKHPFCGWINLEGKTQYYRGLKCLIKNYIYANSLSKLIKDKYPNVILVHTNSIITGFGVELARKLNVPHIYHVREFGKLDFNMSFDLGDRVTSHIIKESKALICISKAVKDYYERLLHCDSLKLVYNGISKEIIDNNKYEYSNQVKILLIGRLSHEKGQEDVIAATERLIQEGCDNLCISFYGDGVDEARLRKSVEEKNLSDYIRFEGYSNHVPYGKFSFAIMASTAEAFGRVTVEYMLNGLPVVGARCGATAELIQDRESGLLYESHNIGELAECIKSLVLNPDMRSQLGCNAKEIASKKFTEEIYWKNVMQVYKECELEVEIG